MFQLVAYLFLVVNGVSAKAPTITLTSKQTFPNRAICMNYFHTPDGIATKSILMSIVSAQNKKNQKYEIRFKCEGIGEMI